MGSARSAVWRPRDLRSIFPLIQPRWALGLIAAWSNIDELRTIMHGSLHNYSLVCMFMSILAAERQQQILERLGRDGRVLASALAEAFATSEDTIRRDLRDLAGRGLCRRVYGGALPVSPASQLGSSPRRRGDRSQGGAGPGVGRPCRSGLVRLRRLRARRTSRR